MKRRDFLKYNSRLGLGSLLLGGTSLKAFATPAMLSSLACDIDDRVMVIIHLQGANDGINTLVPIAQYDTYANLRPNIKIPNSGINQFINLDTNVDSNKQVGLHPAMTGFKELYDQGMLNVVQGVSYPYQNKSHFKSTDLYLTGGDGSRENFNFQSGWMGRYLDNRFPNFSGVPTALLPDPLGIQMGERKPSLGFHTHKEHELSINLTGQVVGQISDNILGIGAEKLYTTPEGDFGSNLEHIMNIENSVSVYAEKIQERFEAGEGISPRATYPDSSIANQLETVATLLAGGSQTKVFLLNQTGYDTHVNQVMGGNTTIGTQAKLLGDLSGALKSFQEDLTGLGLDHRVVTTTFSEFGRKAKQNANYGTDHGTLCPMFIIGTPVMGGVTGNNIDLSKLDNTGAPDMNERQYDYRQVFATILQDWMGASDDALTATKFQNHTKLEDLIKDDFEVDSGCYIGSPPTVSNITVKVKVLLEGFYENSVALSTKLLELGLIPKVQPYNYPPFNYDGNEQVVSLHADTVDWMLFELRNPDNIEEVIARKAAFLRTDGTVWNHDRTEGLTFSNVAAGEYYLTINHRNHLGVTSKDTLSFSSLDIYTYSFYESDKVVRGKNMLVRKDNNWMMRAGDINDDGIIGGKDSNHVKIDNGELDEYLDADLNADGVVNIDDLNLWKKNKSKIGDHTVLK